MFFYSSLVETTSYELPPQVVLNSFRLSKVPAMGGRHAPGSRKGSWAKNVQRYVVKHQSSSDDQQSPQLTAAIEYAAGLLIQLEDSKAELAKSKTATQKALHAAQKAMLAASAIRWRRAKTPGVCSAAPVKVLLRDQATQTDSAPDHASARRIEQLALQVQGLHDENVVLNRARFRCRKCG